MGGRLAVEWNDESKFEEMDASSLDKRLKVLGSR